jgi:DNA-directed RNA polymerase specialized sigma subunit
MNVSWLKSAAARWLADMEPEQCEKLIATIKNNTLREVLDRRFVQGDNLRTIAKKMHYCERHLVRLYKQAMQSLQQGEGNGDNDGK